MKKSALIKTTYLVSHKCYDKVTALQFVKYRSWYVKNLQLTAKKYRISIINYLVTKDGVYLICVVEDPKVISNIMQVLQSSASKQFASKRGGESSMWKGRFAVTVVHGNFWIKQCMLLLDLHMVATGQVTHPAEWGHSGWAELLGIKKRYKVISIAHALGAMGFYDGNKNFRAEYLRLVEACCLKNSFGHLETWVNAVMVGSSDWTKSIGKIIPSTLRSIETFPSSASPLNDETNKVVALTMSKKRRRGYLNIISRKLGEQI